jgi:hypothetical protein
MKKFVPLIRQAKYCEFVLITNFMLSVGKPTLSEFVLRTNFLSLIEPLSRYAFLSKVNSQLSIERLLSIALGVKKHLHFSND